VLLAPLFARAMIASLRRTTFIVSARTMNAHHPLRVRLSGFRVISLRRKPS